MALKASTRKVVHICIWIAAGIALIGISGWVFDSSLLRNTALVLLSLFVTLKIHVLAQFLGRYEMRELEDSQRLAEVIKTQYDLARTNLDPIKLMNLIVERAALLTRADGSVIEIIEGDEMVYRAANGKAKHNLGLRLKTKGSLSGLCVRTGELLYCEDAHNDDRVDRAACDRIGLRSMLVLPLRHQQGVVGVLKVYSARPAAFSEKDISLLKLMSGFLGGMLDQASEAEARRQSEMEVRKLNEVLETKVAERTRELEKSLGQFNEVTDNIDEVFWMTTISKDRMLYISPGYEKIWGYSCQSLYKDPKSFIDHIHPDDRARVLEAMEGQIASDYDIEYRIIRPDGSIRWIRDKAFPARDKNGTIARIVGTASDITAAKDAQRALKASEVRFKQIVDSSLMGLIFWDAEGVGIEANDVLLNMLGYTRDDLRDRKVNWRALTPPDWFETDSHAAVELQSTGRCKPYEKEYFRKDGSRIPILLGSATLDGSDGLAYVGFILDLSEYKKSEEARNQSAAAAAAASESSRLKSEFLANMSHEIRTPINGVIGMTGLLLDTPLAPQQKTFAENIRKAADSLLYLINDILDFSKIEAGKLELENVDFDLYELVSECQKILEFSATSKNIELTIQKCPKFSTYVKGDPGRIRQVLVNLISNGIKFTQKGRVAINVTSGAESDSSAGLLRFEIRDTGSGIPKQAMDRMFHAFSQADSSTTRKFGGTGLGLSICKNIVDLMNGKIGVESVEGVGSLFWFEIRLPFGDSIPKEVLDATNHINLSPARFKGRRILLAEDNPFNQTVVVLQIEKLGIRIDSVANGREAIDALKSAPYDLVFMDCQMPEMDGYEASRVIRASTGQSFQNVPIVALTANAIKGDKDKCIEAGMSDYLAKPARLPDLVRVLEQWLPKDDLTGKISPLHPPDKNVEPVTSSKLKTFNVDRFMHNYGDMSEHLPRLLQTFMASHPRLFKSISDAVDEKNSNTLRERAHALKGALAQIFAERAAALAAELEKLGRDQKLDQAPPFVKELGEEIERLGVELGALLVKVSNAA